ncbi:DddA-like double-stranded DNA deaminase toxin [Actinopolyspora mortivallis]|uniref:DddA-like double-stranded DNA deaminase toxin n=1 Tax=Actinopolyspora mortivallis TaxID=33906 RepID=UPI0009FC6121|nr:DddA-like double-stranded DNA deaminase toxin [Actinopolyspora mortivallis]
MTDMHFEEINQYLLNSSCFPPRPGVKLEVVKHVETRTAWLMKKDGKTSASVVINNEISSLMANYGCRRAVRAILPRG